jgi:hypothetical protein
MNARPFIMFAPIKLATSSCAVNTVKPKASTSAVWEGSMTQGVVAQYGDHSQRPATPPIDHMKKTGLAYRLQALKLVDGHFSWTSPQARFLDKYALISALWMRRCERQMEQSLRGKTS